MKKYIIALSLIVTGCWPHQASLEDVSEEVIAKKEGVVIDIEPGVKK